MESTNTLREILDAERRAVEIYDGALTQRRDLDARIARGKDSLAHKYADKVNMALTAVRAEAAAQADAEIARREAQTNARLDTLREGFALSREGYIDKLFSLVTGDLDE